MKERELEAKVYEYLIQKMSFPKESIQAESTVGKWSNGQVYRADLAILDPIENEAVGLVAVKSNRAHSPLESAVAQLMQYRRVLGKPHLPLYIFFPALPSAGKEFEIAQILPDGDTKEIYPNEFPTFDALVLSDRTNRKTSKKAAVRSAVDTFQVTCIGLSLVTALLFGLDVSGILQLTSRQLVLACISGGLLILPFAARFKMLGVEFERYNSDSER